MSYTLDWYENFPAAYGIIELPANCVFFRGYSTAYPAISERPAYFGSLKTANGYAKSDKGYAVSAFTNSHTLKLFDIRFIKHILRDIFDLNPGKPETLSTILSFGICSLFHQIRLMNMRFKDDSKEKIALMKTYKDDPFIEQPGVRIAETNNDAETLGFIRGLFTGIIDGFISPELKSPYHIEKQGFMSPELIIFNPYWSGIGFYKENTDLIDRLPKKSLESFYSSTLEPRFAKFTLNNQYTFFIGGGDNKDQVPTVEQLNERWEVDSELRDLFEKANAAGKKWKHALFVGEFNPVPTLKITPWVTKKNKTRKHI